MVIIGNPGAGKSRLTFQLINDVCKRTDVEQQSTAKDPLLLNSPGEVLSAMKQHDNLAIAVDDAFGKDSLSYQLARIWSGNSRSITLKCSTISKVRGHCIVINTRKDIFEKSKKIRKGKLLFSEESVVDLEEIKMSDNEKIAMLTEFIPTINNGDIRSVLKAKPAMIGFPQCCYIIAETINEVQQPLSHLFDNPVMPLKEELYRLQSDSPMKYVVLCLILLEGKCPKSHLSASNPICKRLLQMYLPEDVTQVPHEDLSEAANACCPFYLTMKDSAFAFVHNTIHDGVAECLWNEKPSFVIETCTVDVLRRLSLNEESPLYIESNLVCKVKERIRKEILTGNSESYSVLTESEALKDVDFFTELFNDNDLLKARNADNELFLCFLIRQRSKESVNNIVVSNLAKLDPLEIFAAASEGNNEQIVNALLSREVTIDLNIVFSAFKGGNMNIISKILKKSRNLTHIKGRSKHKEKTTTTIFQEACLSGRLDVLNSCIRMFGVDVKIVVNGNDLLYYSIQSHNLELVKFCIENSADSNKRYGVFQESALHTACAEGNIQIIEYLIDAFSCLIHSRDSKNYTPLFNAVSRGYIEIVRLLVKKEADVMDKGKNGRTILHLACWRGQKDMALYLINNFPVLISMSNDNGVQVIHYAALGGSIDLLDHLVCRGLGVHAFDDDKANTLHKACEEPENYEMVRFLTQKYPELKHQLTVDGESPLYRAAFGGSIQVIEHLISEGLDVKQCNNNGNNILHLACLLAPQDKRLSIVKHLIEHFPSLQYVCDKFGATELHCAAAGGSVDVLEYLVEIGYDINDTDTDGETVLHAACQEDDTEDVVRHLTQKYPELKHQLTTDGESALHEAVRMGYIPNLEILISGGLDFNQCNNKGCTILHLACECPPIKKRLSVVRHIIEHFPSLQNVRDKFGSTELHYAAMGGSIDVLEYLIGIGYDINDTDTDGQTVLHKACKQNDNEDMVRHLTQKYPELKHQLTQKSESALHAAVRGGSIQIVQHLLTEGLDASQCDDNGRSFLHITCYDAPLNKRLSLVQYITEQFPHIQHMSDGYGTTTIHYAAHGGSVDVLEYLVGIGHDIHGKDSYGLTVLHWACREIETEVEGMVKHLTQKYPDLKHQLTVNGESALQMAVRGGSIEDIEHLLSEGLDVNQCDNDGDNILHLACLHAPQDRRLSVVKHLIEHFPSLQHVRNKFGATEIHYAAVGGSVDVLEYLVGIGYDINDKDTKGETVLHRACKQTDNEDMIRYMTQKYHELKHQLTTDGESALHKALRVGSIPNLEILISEELNVNQCDNNGNNILHLPCLYAPQHKRLSVLKHLIEHFPSLQHVRNKFGATELHYAAAGGSVDVLEYLVGIGYDINDKDTKGETVLHRACKQTDNEDMIRYLTQKYPELKHQLTTDGESALHKAVRVGSIPNLEILISEELNVNQCDNNGNNILHLTCLYAPQHKRLSVLKHLIEHSPSLQHVRNKFGATELHYAAVGGSVDVLEYLVGIGYDINDKDTNGRNILHWACQKADNDDMVRNLTQKYPEMKKQSALNGASALHLAVIGGSTQVIQHLISEGLDVNQCDNNGKNILLVACKYAPIDKRLSVVQYIVQNFPSLQHVRDKYNATALHCAATGGSIDVLEYLVGIGYDINDKNQYGETVLHRACCKADNEGMVRHLTQKYPELKHQLTVDGESALHKAVRKSSRPITDHLASEGLDINQCNNKGCTILHLACESCPINKRLSVVRHIVERFPSLQHVRDKFGMTEIHYAATGGSIDVLEYLVGIGYDVSEKDKDGETVLHKACKQTDNEDMVRHLTQKYPELKHQLTKDVELALHKALRVGSIPNLEMLISEELDVNQCDNNGNNILHLACLYAPQDKKLSVVRHLIDHFPSLQHVRNKFGATELHCSAVRGSVDVLEYLVGIGYDINDKDTNGRNVLHYACRAIDNEEMVRHLTQKYPELKKQSALNGASALHAAVLGGSTQVIQHLISEGLDVNQCDNNGKNILLVACRYAPIDRRLSVVQYILQNFPSLQHVRDKYNATALHCAAIGGSIDVLEYLVGIGYDINDKNQNGETVLHWACEYADNEDMVKHLTQKYPDLKHQLTVDGESTLHAAVAGGSIEVIEHLLSENLDVNQCDNNGDNILHLACVRAPKDKRLSVVKHLIEYFPSLQHVRNKSGATELHYAAVGGSIDVLEYLVEIGYVINDTDTDGETVLHWACKKDDAEDMIRHLTQKYPDLKNQLTVDGESALHAAVAKEGQ